MEYDSGWKWIQISVSKGLMKSLGMDGTETITSGKVGRVIVVNGKEVKSRVIVVNGRAGKTITDNGMAKGIKGYICTSSNLGRKHCISNRIISSIMCNRPRTDSCRCIVTNTTNMC